MNAASLIDFAHSKFLAAQRLHRFTILRDFEEAIKLSPYEVLVEFKLLIEKQDLDTLRKKVKAILTADLESKSVIELRKLGRAYGVKYWNNIPKTTLIAKLKERMGNVSNPTNVPE